MILGLGLAACEPATQFGIGCPLPRDVRDTSGNEPVLLVWVLDTEACLACQRYDHELRGLLVRDMTPLLVVHVGKNSDQTLVWEFLRNQRIGGQVQTISVRNARRLFAGRELPFFFLAVDDTIRWIGNDPPERDVVTAIGGWGKRNR